MEALEVQTDQNNNQQEFNEIQMKMYRHLYDYGVSITPYVREEFPQGF